MVEKAQITATLDSEERGITASRSEIAIKWMAVPLVVGFTFIDWLYRPDLQIEFLKVRLLVVPVALFGLIFVKLSRTNKHLKDVPAYLLIGFLGLYSAYLISRTGFERSPYYAGLNLVTIGLFCVLPSSLVQMGVFTALIYVPYTLAIMLSGREIDWASLALSTSFCFSSLFLACLANRLTHKLRYAEVASRLNLIAENDSKEKIIRQKTEEGIYLEKLASQFSPQVIEAVRSGAISLDHRTRGEITIIFIDVQGSTGRSLSLDHAEFEEVISDFNGAKLTPRDFSPLPLA